MVFVSSPSHLVRLVSLPALLVILIFSVQSHGQQEDVDAPPMTPEEEMEMLGTTLKAAVMSGALAGEEARNIWRVMMITVKEESAADNARRGRRPAGGKTEGEGDWKSSVARVAVPYPTQVKALLRPAFLERDLQLLREELALDQYQAEIIEALMNNYTEAFELMVVPFQEGVQRYEKSRRSRYVSSVLGRVNNVEVDEAISRTRESMRRIRDEKAAASEGKQEAREVTQEENEKWSEWEEEMVQAAQAMQARLGDIRERVSRQMEDSREPLDAEGVLALAIELQMEGEALRQAFIEQLSVVLLSDANEEKRQRFAEALAMVVRERELANSQLSGDRMDLMAAARQAWRGSLGEDSELIRIALDEVEAMLADQGILFSEVIEARRKATINREIEGLRLLVARDEVVGDQIGSGTAADWAWLGRAAGPYEASLKSELMAAIQVRDMNLGLLDISGGLLIDDHPLVAQRYRKTALQRGFPADMRKRWAQQALDAAAIIETLDAERFETIMSMHDAMMEEVNLYQANGIASRIEREPVRTMERIDIRFDDDRENHKSEFDDEDYLGPDHERYEQLDERVDAQLKAILLPEEYETLPRRRTAEKEGGAGKGRGKGRAVEGRGGGKAGGAGKGGGGKGGGGK